MPDESKAPHDRRALTTRHKIDYADVTRVVRAVRFTSELMDIADDDRDIHDDGSRTIDTQMVMVLVVCVSAIVLATLSTTLGAIAASTGLGIQAGGDIIRGYVDSKRGLKTIDD